MASLATFVVRYRWWVIGAWVVVFLASATLAPRIGGALKQGFGEVDTESRLAIRQMVDALDVSESGVTLVFSSDRLEVTDPAYVAAMEDAIAPLREIPEVTRVIAFYSVPDEALGATMITSDGRTTYAAVELDAPIDESTELVEPIREALADTELDVWVTGGVALFADLTKHSEADLRRAEIITVPLLAIALLIVFGGVVAAGLPVSMGLLSVSTTLALVFLMAQVTDMSVLTLNIATFLGLGMAVDYSLLMVTRFREEIGMAAADGVQVGAVAIADAVSVTMQTSGKAIAFSAGTSVIALSGLLFFDFMMLRSLGVGGITVIVFSMLIALTLLPALFAVLGRRVDSLSLWRGRRREDARGFWFVLSRWVMRHPFAVIVPVVALLLLLGAPFLDVNLGAPWSSMLPERAESRQGDDIVAERFGPSELAHIVLVETSPTSTLSPQNVAANIAFIARMSADPRVARVESVFGSNPAEAALRMSALAASGGTPNSLDDLASSDSERAALGSLLSDDLRTQLVRVVPAHPPTSDETRALLSDIRADPPDSNMGGDMTVRVTGVTADLDDTIERMYADFPWVIVYVMVVTYLALFFLLRSALLPLKAVILNALSILAGFGALVFIFQQGNFEWLFGFTSGGYTEATAPILIFSVVFGLSMDYEVFLLSRVKEEYEKDGDNARAVSVGMQRSGRVITSAAAILILVSLGFATGDILLIKAIGVGTAIAVLIDATIVRALLVPALMRVMAGANWWAPRWLGGGPEPVPD